MIYTNIEREMAAIIYDVEIRFNQYVYGKTSRLQRMLLRLQRYSIAIRYVPGKENYAADTLSRAHLNDKNTDIPTN
ncbi:hypothetical protein MAR_027499 [Mya arenaria]|uniref:Reverse transcriptase RNase H-like domain-containing protein n=1 Tax=Mya arenaria TaxID=6604 RepID=A0ABY7EW21_MYAAR|nr:hypothetical protein MAR_027499 [Mya arenaria]